MGLSRNVSEIDGDFSRNRNFSYPRVNNAPTVGFPLEFGIISAQGVKKLELWSYQMVEKFQDRFSRLETIPVCM